MELPAAEVCPPPAKENAEDFFAAAVVVLATETPPELCRFALPPRDLAEDSLDDSLDDSFDASLAAAVAVGVVEAVESFAAPTVPAVRGEAAAGEAVDFVASGVESMD